MELTILIVTYKSESIIENCLSSINKKYPILVIENSANIEFKKKLEKKYLNLKCILTGKNLGFGKANNIGLRKINTKYVFLLNPDTKLKKNTLKFILYYAKKIGNFALLAPLLLNSKDINYGFFDTKKKISLNKNNDFFQVDYIKGFAMFFNKNKFKKINFFDENIFMYLEEIDLCKRIKNQRENIYIIKKAKIIHYGAKSHNSIYNHKMELSRNWHWMWSKFYYKKKHDGIFVAYIDTLFDFIKNFIKLNCYFFFNKKKFLIYKSRFDGLLQSYLNKKSYYRPFGN